MLNAKFRYRAFGTFCNCAPALESVALDGASNRAAVWFLLGHVVKGTAESALPCVRSLGELKDRELNGYGEMLTYIRRH